eukprot:CAMPEP_0197040368 /NCGR_PEP_ID=MMETSP1384-20130603/17088_1 /TAXON_ID=29189 /ORGANISM="Ammonia sp." /LENGTH=538 /DNA_ID=CAMNT_0042471111 /DNA_START=21 /DNA_END=1637 /DNA_ORIENTATION=-
MQPPRMSPGSDALRQKIFFLRLSVCLFWAFVIVFALCIYVFFPHNATHQTIIESITQINAIVPSVSDLPQNFRQSLFSSSAQPSNFVPEAYYDPESRCDLPIDHDPHKRNPRIVYTNKFPDDVSIEEIMAKRVEPVENIPMCPNADRANFEQHKQLLSKLPTNMVAYANRCQINAIGRGGRQFGGLLSGDPLMSHLSTQIGFLHVYKAGGTTVRDTMNNVLPGLGRTIWHNYRGHLREFMTSLFMFSFIRDPVTRAISSYFELHRRNETDICKNNMAGVDSFRFMSTMMNNRMDCSLANKNKYAKMKDLTVGEIYFNMHIMPQMYFLTEGQNPWKPWPVNYVGNMTELTDATFEVMWDFYWNSSDYLEHHKLNDDQKISYEDAKKEFEKHYHHGRDRHYKKYFEGGERHGVIVGDQAKRYQIELDNLSDDDIRDICNLYWMDYICLPFDIPKQCNLTELLLRHYGDDVVYKDCWEYETKQWDVEWKGKYINGSVPRGRKTSDQIQKRMRDGLQKPKGAKKRSKVMQYFGRQRKKQKLQ